MIALEVSKDVKSTVLNILIILLWQSARLLYFHIMFYELAFCDT